MDLFGISIGSALSLATIDDWRLFVSRYSCFKELELSPHQIRNAVYSQLSSPEKDEALKTIVLTFVQENALFLFESISE